MNSINGWKNKLEEYLLNHTTDDGGHDLSHFRRVWKTAQGFITDKECKLTILAAAYLHDIVAYEKNDPRRSLSSKHAALKAKEILLDLKFPQDIIPGVMHAIEAHSFSADIETKTDEAKIIQDADRMEALGAIGLARTFYTAGRMSSMLFHPTDPFAENRELDDTKFGLDHFKVKLLTLSNTMKTELGKKEAQRRSEILLRFLKDLKIELNF